MALMPVVFAALFVAFSAAGNGQIDVGGKPSERSGPDASLAGTSWRAIELAGTPVGSRFAADREPHLVFGTDGRLSGADGCNRLTGPYTVKGEAITFGQLAGTQMACFDTAEIADRFRSVLKGTAHWRIVKDRLEFYGATGKPIAVFERRPTTTLQGTRWQLMKFQGGDDRTLTPDDPAKYTIEFLAGGQLAARIDCNRGRGTWKVAGESQIELGSLALTRAKCPEGSLHDQIVKQWTFIRSFVMKDGHLFLAVKLDSGIYEFAPAPAK